MKPENSTFESGITVAEGVRRIGDLVWEVEIGFVPRMRVPGRFFLSPDLCESLEKGALTQLANVATLPGIVRHSLAMPDIHWGYGFPIGGVAAFELEEGIISPGGVGFDINCGVRFFTTPLGLHDLGNKRELIENFFREVPTGVGAKSKHRFSGREIDEMMLGGARWAIERGFGMEGDSIHCEEGGAMPGVDLSAVSPKARQRGMPQAGTLGAGNHFLEIQEVKQIYDEDAARAYGLSLGQICIMIHCGSRGLGHQVCTDHLKLLDAAVRKYNIWLPDRQLACAPLTSTEGEAYFGAMAGAANYAWANRQVITHMARNVLERMFKIPHEEMPLVYDVAHNVAKFEDHRINGNVQRLCVHRKGATRAFGPDSPEIPKDYAPVGQPVIIPGSMGTPSYILHGTSVAMELSFGSTCHGAGRVTSRTQAKKQRRGSEVRQDLQKRGILVRAPSDASIAEEAPEVYKSSSAVVQVVHDLGLSRLVARMEPLGVIKG